MNTIQKKADEKAVTAEEKKNKTIRDYVGQMEGEIARALPSVMTPERFTRMVLSAISTTPALARCTPQSFLGSMMTAAQLGVEPNTALGQAYILPYKNHGTMEAQFQLGYKGLIDLAYRSGEVESIQAQVVYENDLFEAEYGLNPKLVHKPADHDRGEPVKVWASFRTKSGGYGFEVMSMDDVRRHAERYSKAYNTSFSPWKTNFEEMAKKTVLKRVLKYAPLRSDFVKAVVQDQTIKTKLDEDMVNIPDETIYDADYEDVTVDEKTGEVTNYAE